MPTKTNSTTQAIIDFVKFNGGAAFRINTSGIPIIKAGRVAGFRKSRNKGAADIRIVYKGFSIDVEIKTGKDKQSPDQWAFQQEIERAGGVYWLVENVEEFITLFEQWKTDTIKHKYN